MLDAIAQSQRSRKCPCGVVIMGLWETENGDHRIADEFLQDAAVLDHRLARDVVVPSQQVPNVLGVERIAECRRSGDVGEQHGDDAALFGHRLTLEKADAAAATETLRATLTDHADTAVVFQYGEADIAHLVEAMFSDRHLDVVDAQALFVEILLHEIALVDQQRRRRLDQAVERRPAAAQHRDAPVEDEKRRHNDRSAGDRAVGSGHRRLERVRHQQHEHQVKGCELAQLALPEQSETDEEDHVDEGGANDQVPPRNAQVE